MDRTKWIIIGSVSLLIVMAVMGIWYLRTRALDEVSVPTQPADSVSESSTDESSTDLRIVVTSTPALDEQREQVIKREMENQKLSSQATEEVKNVPAEIAPAPSPTDSDRDGLSNDQELQLGTDPNRTDTDGDGLGDSEEVVKYKTNPKNADSDGDGFKDGAEVSNGYNPLGK